MTSDASPGTAARALSPARSSAPSEKVNILIVDDRADKRLSLAAALAELDESIVLAESGNEALRCLLREDFAVILLDVNMPMMDGFETAALIRQRQRSELTPIIFVSAINDTDNHVSRGYSLGAVDYILTPVVPEILRAKVSVFVDLFRKTAQIKQQAEERANFIRAEAARVEAETARERSAFLAEASNVLAASLDYQETFGNLARLAVPRLADFCLIDMAEEDGGLKQVAVAHREPAEEEKLRRLIEHYPRSLQAKHGGVRVFQTGKSEMCCDLDESMIADMFEEPAARELVRSLKPTSFIAAPLQARGRVLGAITLVTTTSGRTCGPNELSLAEELAQRAALALDNAALYQAAQEARREAERASRSKDEFLAMLSHELRTPLSPVLSAVALLESDESCPPSVRDALQMIHRNATLEARLIDDLLDLTRVSKGKIQLSLEIVDAHHLLRSAVEICESDINAKPLRLALDLQAERPFLLADPARLQQIFWNLLKNSVKFTPPKGQLSVRTRNEDGIFRMEVEDNGVGIEPEVLPRIFNAFEQGARHQAGGLGLGLAITRALVEMHGGEITASSGGRDHGATFVVTFDTVDAPELQVANGPNDLHHGERLPLRLLLVEDHLDTQTSLARLLQRRGYEVQVADSVAAARALAPGYGFDVLISDMGLPDGTGIELMEELSQSGPVRAIALSGYGMEEDIRRSREAGFSEHLTKPVNIQKLDVALQRLGGIPG